MLIWKLETGSFTLSTWSTHSFHSTLFTLELFVYIPVSLAAQYTISIFDGSFYISCALTHILTRNLHIVNATQFFKIMKPTWQSLVSWVTAGKTVKQNKTKMPANGYWVPLNVHCIANNNDWHLLGVRDYSKHFMPINSFAPQNKLMR